MNRPKKEKGIRRTHNVMVRFKQRCLPPHTLESSRMCKSTEDFPIRQGLLKIRRRKIFKNNNLFEIVKLNITTRQAAEAYGFRPNRSSMICCPFHADRNPSMKVDFRFHCFGCGADGDVIDFTAKLFQLSLLQAAEKLAADFGLSATDNFQPLPCKPVEKPLSPKEQFYKILCGYRSLLADWRMAYAPKNPEASLHPCFVASLHYADRVQYLLDILLLGSLPEKQQLLNGKEVTALGKAIERCKETEEAA